MAMENKRITQLSTERLNLTSGDYVLVDDENNGSAKYRLDRLKETDSTLSVSGMAADAAATGQAISDETTARENADNALDEDISDLKSALSNTENKTGIYFQNVKWIKGNMTAAGVITTGDYAISDIVSHLTSIRLGNNCQAIVFVYSGTTCIGKVNSNFALDQKGGASGTWFYFTDNIDVKSILSIATNFVDVNADSIRIMIIPTDGTVITDSNVYAYGSEKTEFIYDKNTIDIINDSTRYMQNESNSYIPEERTWIKSLISANGITMAGNGALSNIIHNVSGVTISSGSKAILLLYAGTTYVGKTNVAFNIDQVSGSWGYFYKSIDVNSYFDKYEADGCRIVLVPTDNSTLDPSNIAEWANAHCTFSPSRNQMDEFGLIKPQFEKNVYDTSIITWFIKGGYRRDGIFDSTSNFLLTTAEYVPEGYDTIKLLNDFVGILFAFNDSDTFYGGMYTDYTLSGGYYGGTFYFTDEIDIGFFQKAFPNLNYKLIVKKNDDSAISFEDAVGSVVLIKKSSASIIDVNEKISGVNPVGGFGYARDNFILSIGHRGGNADMPENTLPNFISGARSGMLYVETDIAYTSDNVPVLLHDLTINRTARNPDGTELENTIYIDSITYAQALEYDFGIYKGAQYAGTKIMTFDEFILLCKQLSLTPFIELKRESTNDPDIHTQERVNNLISIVKKYNMQHHVLWGSFDTMSVARVLKTDKNASVGIAISGSEINNPILLDLKIGTLKAFKNGANYVFGTVRTDQATNDLYEILENNGIPIIEYMINSAEQALAIKDHASTIGGLTDYHINIGDVIRQSLLEA